MASRAAADGSALNTNVRVKQQEMKCQKVAVATTGTAVTFPNTQKTGDCMGDALRGHKKDVTKFSFSINSDGSCTFHSTCPDLMLKKGPEVATDAAAPSGKRKGRVPLIMDSIVNFNDGGAMLKNCLLYTSDAADE